ncbi:hypothetical protein CUU64_03385 [Bacillus sp. V5-8f]|nr:hypothetical protein CUU64_03385 [Bacillus sp. V5-8f]
MQKKYRCSLKKKFFRKKRLKVKKVILLFAAMIIASSLGHQINGGYKDPRKSRPRYFHLK